MEVIMEIKELAVTDEVQVVVHAKGVGVLVRCKDCKFRDDEDVCYGRGSPYQFVPDDGYCDRGKGRDDAEIH